MRFSTSATRIHLKCRTLREALALTVSNPNFFCRIQSRNPEPSAQVRFDFLEALGIPRPRHRHRGIGDECEAAYPRADMNGEPPDVVAHRLHLARVQPDPHVDPELPGAVPDRLGAADRALYGMKRGHREVRSLAHIAAFL